MSLNQDWISVSLSFTYTQTYMLNRHTYWECNLLVERFVTSQCSWWHSL